jgi:hypothetical protein
LTRDSMASDTYRGLRRYLIGAAINYVRSTSRTFPF